MGFIAFLIVVIGGLLVVMGALSHLPPELGLQQGRLLPCPDKPNCRTSEVHLETAVRNLTTPLYLEGMPAEKAWARLKVAIHLTGGVLVEERAGYLHATFTSSWFRFVDDFEARLDASREVIHLRSASRVGYSDLGTNRIRLEQLRAAFKSSGA